jgi:hypothetical protein
VVSFGEFARVGDDVVFSMPVRDRSASRGFMSFRCPRRRLTGA